MSRSFLILTALGVFGVSALAAPATDPYIHIGDPVAGTPVGTTFGFTSNLSGGGALDFVNASSVTFSSLDFFVSLPAGDVVTCVAAPFFSSCSFSEQVMNAPNPLFDIGADSGPGSTGIAPGTTFSIILNDPINQQDNTDPNGSGGWGPDNSFTAIANLDTATTPEPATWALLMGGLGVIAAYARRTRR